MSCLSLNIQEISMTQILGRDLEGGELCRQKQVAMMFLAKGMARAEVQVYEMS